MAITFTLTKRSRLSDVNEHKFRRRVEGILVIDNTDVGAQADDLPASFFGLNKITELAYLVSDGENRVLIGVPDYTGDSLIIAGGSSNSGQDLANDTYRIVLVGE